MEYSTTGAIRAVFQNGQVIVTVNGQQFDLMAVQSMEDMRVILSAISLDVMTSAMAQLMAPPIAEESDTVDMPPSPETNMEGYAEQIRQSFQDQATKSQERLQELASLHENTT